MGISSLAEDPEISRNPRPDKSAISEPAAIARIRSAVCSSAGKNVSSASSDSVMSTGVPNTMVVEMKLRTSPSWRSLKGIATLSADSGAERAGIG